MHLNEADHRDGILHIDQIREVPEALKPRQIAIANGAGVTSLSD
jgi:molecular chaperone IbpA